jgi:exoribonuclease-2
VNAARLLIENFMIAANVAMTTYMTAKGLPVIRRVVKTPKRWDRIVALAKEYNYELSEDPDPKSLQAFLARRREEDPLHFQDLSLAIIKLIGRGEYVVAMPGEPSIGHFDLALTIYSHTTAPNRRYPDVIMQRLLKSHFSGALLPYQESELNTIAQHCTIKEDDAAKVERRVLKSATAMVIRHQVGQIFPAMITGVNDNGTWARLFNPPIEGKLVHGQRGLDVGDTIKAKLVNVDVLNGYIDFSRAN